MCYNHALIKIFIFNFIIFLPEGGGEGKGEEKEERGGERGEERKEGRKREERRGEEDKSRDHYVYYKSLQPLHIMVLSRSDFS